MSSDDTPSREIYCPYTDAVLDREDTSPEHIIPLSLGGANGFEIRVDKNFNKKVGSTIDGKLADDFLTKLRRIKSRVVGHSGKAPTLLAKTAEKTGTSQKLSLKLSRPKGVELWDNRAGKKINFDSNIKFAVTLDMREFRIVRLRFIAKAALSAGYFIYNDAFRNAVDHQELRKIMNFDGNIDSQKAKEITARVDVELERSEDPAVQAFKYVTTIIGDSSCIGIIPLKGTMAFFVGILGVYLGMIAVPCNHAALPKDGIHSLGTFVGIQDGRPIICSWERLIGRVGEQLKKRQETRNHMETLKRDST